MATQEQAFKIRWGKLSLALVGFLALVAIPVTFVVACFTALSFWVPLLCAVLVVAAFVGLRTSAIRERRRRAWARAESAIPEGEVAEKSRQDPQEQAASDEAAPAAQDAAEATQPSKQDAQEQADEETAEAAPDRAEEAFDFEAGATSLTETASAASAHEFETSTGADDDSETERENRDSVEGETGASAEGDTDATAEQDRGAQRGSAGSTWSPRTVPAPTYTTAEPVERALPAAQPAEDEKKASTITSIRRAERDRVESERDTGSESTPAIAVGDEAAMSQAESAKRLDLDAVLQRRRA